MNEYDHKEEEVEVKAEPAVSSEPKAKAKVKEKPVTAVPTHTAVPAGTVVSMGALVHKSMARNSASVRAVQTRLLELGHLGAGADLPGWLADGTLEALTEFHSGAKVKGDVLSAETIQALFKGVSVKVQD